VLSAILRRPFKEKRMLTLPLALVTKTGRHELSLVLKPEELELSKAFSDPAVDLRLNLSANVGGVLVQGKVSAKAELGCSRCLELYQQDVQAEITVNFEPIAHSGEIPEGSEDGLGYVAFHGEDLPIGEELRQELELSLPARPLCKPDCKGLCSSCGIDLNRASCDCDQRRASGPFAGLDELLASASDGSSESGDGKGRVKKTKGSE
jgi:uncharacterized protein